MSFGLFCYCKQKNVTREIRNARGWRRVAMDVLYVATGYMDGCCGGLFRSADGGASWETLLTTYADFIRF
jgi:hypothetical protein